MLKLVLDGRKHTLSAVAGNTLTQVLAEAGIVLEELDRVWPKPQTKVREGLSVKVETVRDRLETREEPVAPGFRIQLTTKIRPGVQQVVQVGRAGSVEVTERVVSVGGRRVRVSPISRQLIRAADDKIIALGSDSRFMPHTVPYHKRYARAYQAERTLSARGGSARARFEIQSVPQTATLRPIRSFMAHTSAYAAGPAGGSIGNYTATGMRCVRGAVAVDPKVIPLGTKLYIEGYGYGFACDTGSAIKGKRIDLAFNTVRECFQHGRRVNKVWILAN